MSNGEPKSRRGTETEWFDLRTLTEYLAVSERTVRDWIHRGSDPLPAVRVGTKILVRRSMVDAWLESHPVTLADRVDLSSTVDEILADLAGKS